MEYIKPARAVFIPAIPNVHVHSMVQFKIEKLLTHRAKKFPAIIEPEGSVMCSKNPAIELRIEPVKLIFISSIS